MAQEQSYDTVSVILASDVANGGTFTVGYPPLRNAGSYALAWGHRLRSNKYGTMFHGTTASFSFGVSNVTITNNSGVTLEAQTQLFIQLDRAGGDLAAPVSNGAKMAPVDIFAVSLGAASAPVANGVMASQAVTAAGGPATGLNGSLSAAGVATFDVPRNVVAAWTGAAVLTVTGTDEFGSVLKESSASGTSFTGKKAFKTVTAVSVSADVTGATVGTGSVLGLPVFLSDIGRVTRELQDGVAATAGTVVKGDRTKATATTGDVRGTYAPNATPDGSKALVLFLALDHPGAMGVPQYAG